MTQLSLDDLPRARATDPHTSHLAAAVIEPGLNEMQVAIRRFVRVNGPATAFEIADAVAGDRWQHDSVRAEVARLLNKSDSLGRSPGGRPCVRYELPDEIEGVQVAGERL